MDLKKVKAKLVENGYNQREFAKDMNQSINTVNATLTGKRVPNVEEVRKMCQLLHVTTPEEQCEIFLR